VRNWDYIHPNGLLQRNHRYLVLTHRTTIVRTNEGKKKTPDECYDMVREARSRNRWPLLEGNKDISQRGNGIVWIRTLCHGQRHWGTKRLREHEFGCLMVSRGSEGDLEV
jgi:hypothetical protein